MWVRECHIERRREREEREVEGERERDRERHIERVRKDERKRERVKRDTQRSTYVPSHGTLRVSPLPLRELPSLPEAPLQRLCSFHCQEVLRAESQSPYALAL